MSYIAYAPPWSVTDDDMRQTTTDAREPNNAVPYSMCRRASNKYVRNEERLMLIGWTALYQTPWRSPELLYSSQQVTSLQGHDVTLICLFAAL